jgi:hypothetical protein
MSLDDARTLEGLLDLRNDLADETRITELVELLRNHLLQKIDEVSSIAGLRQLFRAGGLERMGIRGSALEVL